MQRGRFLVPLIMACLALSLFAIAYPMYVIRPFRHQEAGELALALVVSQFRPITTTLLAIAAIVICVLYWRVQERTGRRVLATLGAIFATLLAVVGRINVYELMFHPDSHPSFSAASASKLDSDEKVIAVHIDGEARAYPVRDISYHHVINDVVGREPIVATY